MSIYDEVAEDLGIDRKQAKEVVLHLGYKGDRPPYYGGNNIPEGYLRRFNARNALGGTSPPKDDGMPDWLRLKLNKEFGL